MILEVKDWFSKNLSRKQKVSLLYPANIQRSTTKILYLLHGLHGDHTSWLSKTTLKEQVTDLDLLIVLPNADNSYYSNYGDANRYWDYIAYELPQQVESYFSLPLTKENFYIAGLSMGGYGAMKLALTMSQSIAAVASFSGALDLGRVYNLDQEHTERFDRIFTSKEQFERSSNNLFNLTRPMQKLPRLLITCGTNDFLYQGNISFVEHLKKQKIPVSFIESAQEDHTWSYWEAMLRYALNWMNIT